MRLLLKRLPTEALDAALEKAERYRDLNQPEEAESICRDVLDVVPDHQHALRILGLSMSDQFVLAWRKLFDSTLKTFARLTNDYERIYYTGIAWERSAKAQLEQGETQNAATSFERAMECFEKAEKLAPHENPDPILRWNRCVRALSSNAELRDARESPRATEFRYDD
jgi:tetratricopeptide (TPR) repeat protein